ncbi:hypothetical protein DPMN_005426 [Dreissena polymorpha]|uniref:Uncharacterized protein n=1 Tax=Dreissena polymorpha TaxID=45954 RepID=A0A9D4MSN9_DREPO|nr:hypothetical protein DPMN_005426 [Dreissena polymorpha]
MATRQRRFEVRVVLLLDGLSSKTSELHLPEACGYGATDPPLPLLLSVVAVLPGYRQATRAGQELDLVDRGYVLRPPLRSIL